MAEKQDITKVSKNTQFSSENQPPKGAASKGQKKWWDRRKFKNELFQEFAKPLTPEGIEIPTFEAGVELYKRAIFHEDSGHSNKERAEMFMKFCDFVGTLNYVINLIGYVCFAVYRTTLMPVSELIYF